MSGENCDSYIGQHIKEYTLLYKLGGGGSAHVYLASSGKNDHVAIKLLDTKDSHFISTYRQSFFQESRILRMLRHHPHILPIIDDGEHEGNLYIITEYAPGGTLRDHFRTLRPIKLNEALRIILQIGEAIDRVHLCSIVHNDLKPENILFNKKDEALLADFGIAVQLNKNAEWYGSPRGTYAYMAPEQFDGVFTPAGDQYALGCVAYEILTEKHPLEYHLSFNPYNLETMRDLHRNARILPLRQLNTDIPEYIDQAIMQTLAKRPSMRHASVASFIRSLYPSTYLSPDADLPLSPILNTPPPDLSGFASSYENRPPAFALQIEAREIPQPIKQNNSQVPSDAPHSPPPIVNSHYDSFNQNNQCTFISGICPYRDGDGTVKPKRKISEVLYDLRLPEAYGCQLVSPLERLGLYIAGGELESQHGGRSRMCTVVKNRAGYSRSFLFVPDSILVKEGDETESAFDYLRNWFPNGSTLTLFHNKTPALEIRRIIKRWEIERKITVILVPSQDLRILKKPDEGAKRSWLTQDLQLQDLIDHQYETLSVQLLDQNEIYILIQIIMKLPQVIDHPGRGWRLLLSEAGLGVIVGELDIQGSARNIAWDIVMYLKTRARLPEKPQCEALGLLLLHICYLPSIPFEDRRKIQQIVQKYSLTPLDWIR